MELKSENIYNALGIKAGFNRTFMELKCIHNRIFNRLTEFSSYLYGIEIK